VDTEEQERVSPRQKDDRADPKAELAAKLAARTLEAARRLSEESADFERERAHASDILTALPFAIVLADEELKVIWANRASAGLLGVARDRLCGRSLVEVPAFEGILAQAEAVATSGEPVQACYFGRGVNERVLSIWMSQVSVTPAPGQQILLVIEDVSEWVRSQKEELARNRHFETFLEAALDAVVVMDTTGAITHANRAAESLFGWSRQELVGEPVTKLMPEQYRKNHLRAMARFAATGEGELLGKVLRVAGLHRSGKVMPLEMTLSRFSFDGRWAAAAMIRDVGSKIEAEQEESHSAERFRSLLEQLPDAIVVEQGGKIVYANPAALELLQCREADEILGRPLLALLHPDERGRWKEAAFEAAPSDRSFVPVELRLRTAGGESVDVEAVALTIDFAGQRATASVFRDVRERKRLQAQLMHADRMASMGTLAAGIAHEINNPVAFVHSNLGALEKYVRRMIEFLDFCTVFWAREDLAGVPAFQEFLREAARKREDLKLDYILGDIPKLVGRSKEGTERIKKIVSDLKTFARSDEGMTEVDVNQTLELALNIAWNEIKYKADVVRDFAEVPRVRGSSTALGQVFLNILVNAAQAIVDKGTITIKTWQAAGSVFVRISDTGSGIAPEHINKIFDPFFTTKPPGKGTGLGLNIAYNIIRRHNGTIQVESKQREGTSFTISLPAGGAQ